MITNFILTNLCYNMHGDIMKKQITVQYKSIFKYEDHQETMKCQGIGEIEQTPQLTVISFQDQDQIIQIELHEEHVILKHGMSKLKLVKNKKVMNHYATDYGMIELTSLLHMIDTKNGIKMKYTNYDHQHVINEAYVLLTYKEYHDETEDENETVKEIIN